MSKENTKGGCKDLHSNTGVKKFFFVVFFENESKIGLDGKKINLQKDANLENIAANTLYVLMSKSRDRKTITNMTLSHGK